MTKGVATNIGIHRQNGNDQGGGGGEVTLLFPT